MQHIKMTADIFLGIVNGVLQAADFEIEIDDKSTTVMKELNIEFYSFKRRVKAASDYLESMEKSLNQAYCLCEMTNVERLFSRDIDHLTIDGRLTAWLQTDKIKLLEALIEECNAEFSGAIFEVPIGSETRNALVQFGTVQLQEVRSATEIGEAATVSIAVKVELAPSISSYNDYKIELSFDGGNTYLVAPYTSWTLTYTASQVAMPLANKSDSGFINVSRSNNISLSLYDFNEGLTAKLRAVALRCNAIGQTPDNLNDAIYMRITVDDKAAETYVYKMLAKTITLASINTSFNTIAVVLAPKGGI